MNEEERYKLFTFEGQSSSKNLNNFSFDTTVFDFSEFCLQIQVKQEQEMARKSLHGRFHGSDVSLKRVPVVDLCCGLSVFSKINPYRTSDGYKVISIRL